MTTVTTGTEEAATDTTGFRQRLLDGLAESIVEDGYRNTTVADVVRHARTSRRTFYEHFDSKETCFVALLTETTTEMIREITAAVAPTAPWASQVRQAVEAWLECAESQPTIMLSWIRDVPSLGAPARALQRDTMAAFVTMIQTLCDTDEWRAVGVGPVPRQLAILLVGGLRELIATTVEDGEPIAGMTETAVRATAALLGSLVQR